METKFEAHQLRLEVVPTHLILLHEESDPHRVERLDAQITEAGLIKNPPIVAATSDGRYVVLDGATRITAIRNRKYPHSVVQIVPYGTSAALLGSWYHVVIADIAEQLRQHFSSSGHQTADVAPSEALEALNTGVACVGLTLDDTRALIVRNQSHSSPASTARLLREVAAIYGGAGEIHRIVNEDLLDVVSKNSPNSSVVMFPTFSPNEILEFATTDNVLPAGITRHLIQGRMINVNIPLSFLCEDSDIQLKQTWLKSWITEKVMNKKARYYHESVFVFDD